MNCIHDGLATSTTMLAIPETGGTVLVCSVCASGAKFNINGERVSVLRKGVNAQQIEPEDSPQLRMAEFEQQSIPPTWVCGMGQVHPVGEPCTLEHE